ncbi:MAG: carbonic anhydrase [Verrucomicrobiae bacterium]|nr:carbonic anhydrase [Verrucomicrobiae bacterium]
MHLFEAIIDANHRAVAGDANASLRPAEFADELPIIALTCIDPRLNALFPNVIGLPGEQFIWLRNAGNIITGTLSSTMRSLALACAVKGGREIAIIGHTDCHVAKTTTTVLLDQLKVLGVDRAHLPANLSEFFGTFGSERQNVIKACTFARSSPLIGPKIPVHGLMVDIETGKLDWVVNGYETLHAPSQPTMAKTDFATMGALGSFKDFDMGEMKFPEMKIGDAALPAKPVEPAPKPAMITVPPAATPPPPIKKSPLPPIKMKPPLNPYKDFRRG